MTLDEVDHAGVRAVGPGSTVLRTGAAAVVAPALVVLRLVRPA